MTAASVPTQMGMSALRHWGLGRHCAVLRLRDVDKFLDPNDLAEHVAVPDVVGAHDLELLLGSDRLGRLGDGRVFGGGLGHFRSRRVGSGLGNRSLGGGLGSRNLGSRLCGRGHFRSRRVGSGLGNRSLWGAISSRLVGNRRIESRGLRRRRFGGGRRCRFFRNRLGRRRLRLDGGLRRRLFGPVKTQRAYRLSSGHIDVGNGIGDAGDNITDELTQLDTTWKRCHRT